LEKYRALCRSSRKRKQASAFAVLEDIRMAGAKALPAIAWAGALCGTLDITAAIVVYGRFGARPMPLLQGIAAGLLGPSAYQGGWPTALLGLFLHFVIAFGAATVYFLASRKLHLLINQWFVCGILYGMAVYFFMQKIVLPLSLATRHRFSWEMMWIGVVIHIFCVGLPIAGMIRWKS
jgi:hypothetical protein